jgi:brefeldin A-resistance guanine nucleotide exchange factor 1
MRGENSRQKKSKKPKESLHILQKNMSTSLSQTVLKAESEPQPATGKSAEESRPNVTVSDVDAADKPAAAADSTDDKQSQIGFYLTEPRKKTLSESSASSTKTNEAANGSASLDGQPGGGGGGGESVTEDTLTVTISSDSQTTADAELNTSTTSIEAERTLKPGDNSNPEGTPEDQDYVNPRGVRFVQDGPNAAHVPYGLPCLRELLRFLISLTSSKNPEHMIVMGLNLITVGLESGADHLAAYQSLLAYVKDDLAKNLFTLLSTERLPVYASVLRVLFLLFESLRGHLKYQLEFIFTKLMSVITFDTQGNNKQQQQYIQQEMREMTIEFLLQMLRLPGFAVELYINYDCALNCTNLFEDLTKLLSKNAFSVQSLLTANSLSLSALLTIVENIELENTTKQSSISNDRLNFLQGTLLGGLKSMPSSGYSAATLTAISKSRAAATGLETATNQTQNNAASGRKVSSMFSVKSVEGGAGGPSVPTRVNRMKVNVDKLPTHDQLRAIRIRKRIMQQSVDLFNRESPAKAIQFLNDNAILASEPATQLRQLIAYLKDTPALDKKVMGDYLSHRKNLGTLDEFVRSFDFAHMRIDESLRLFLETFRLPGEAPLISNVMEHFARHWRASNPEAAFANDDAAFTLAYAIIMLNVDQHNHNVKKQSTPMVVEQFKRNVGGVNGGGNFDDKLLEEIYAAVRGEEIVMPAEHTGPLRDNYLWKVLVRRDRGKHQVIVAIKIDFQYRINCHYNGNDG